MISAATNHGSLVLMPKSQIAAAKVTAGWTNTLMPMSGRMRAIRSRFRSADASSWASPSPSANSAVGPAAAPRKSANSAIDEGSGKPRDAHHDARKTGDGEGFVPRTPERAPAGRPPSCPRPAPRRSLLFRMTVMIPGTLCRMSRFARARRRRAQNVTRIAPHVPVVPYEAALAGIRARRRAVGRRGRTSAPSTTPPFAMPISGRAHEPTAAAPPGRDAGAALKSLARQRAVRSTALRGRVPGLATSPPRAEHVSRRGCREKWQRRNLESNVRNLSKGAQEGARTWCR